jgi:hypothetical protein
MTMTERQTRKSVEVRPATEQDCLAYYGRTIPWPWFGLAAVSEGVVVGIGGVAWTDDGATAFLNCDRGFMPGALRSHKLAKQMLDMAHKSGERTIFVIPTPGVKTAKRWLSALGFSFDHMQGSLEVWKSCQD